MTGPFWSWLHGPEDQPDPHIDGECLSSVTRHRGEPPRVPWDAWLNQPIRETTEGAA